MISRTVQITTTSTSAVPSSSYARRQSDSFWNDADVGGFGSTYGDASAGRSDAATVGSCPSRDVSEDCSLPSWLNLSNASDMETLAVSLLRSALMGAAAALGYHISSAATRHVLNLLEQRFSHRSGREEINISASRMKILKYPPSHLCGKSKQN